jgi:hypothetical protein
MIQGGEDIDGCGEQVSTFFKIHSKSAYIAKGTSSSRLKKSYVRKLFSVVGMVVTILLHSFRC